MLSSKVRVMLVAAWILATLVECWAPVGGAAQTRDLCSYRM